METTYTMLANAFTFLKMTEKNREKYKEWNLKQREIERDKVKVERISTRKRGMNIKNEDVSECEKNKNCLIKFFMQVLPFFWNRLN